MGTAPAVGIGELHLFQAVAQLGLTALITFALLSFHRVYRHRYLLHWGLSWSAHGFFLLFAAGAAMVVGNPSDAGVLGVSLSVLSMTAGYLQIAWLLLGTWELAGRRDASRAHSRAVVVAGLLVTAVSLIIPDVALASAVSLSLGRLGLRWLLASIAYLAAALGVVWSSRQRPATFGRNIMGAALAGLALEQGAYFVLAVLPGPPLHTSFALMGVFDLAAMAGLALAVVIWLLEDERERVLAAVEETRRRQRAQTWVYRISEAAHSVRHLPDLFRSIHAIIAEAIPASNFYIALLDRDTGLLSFPYFVDEHDTAPPPQHLGRGLTEYVLRNREPLLATPEVFDELVLLGEVDSVGPASVDWLGVPLLSGNEGMGVLAVQTYDPTVRLGEEERDFLVFVSEQVATAIEAKRAEEALRRAAKEESLTVLAGGVAHDFNNLLAAVLGHVSLALAKLPPDDAARGHVEKAAATVERAAGLTRQMLAYSGRGTFLIKPTDLEAVIQGTLPLLEVALPKNVRLVTRLDSGLPRVDADEGQLQQVLMNLVINGAEAVGEGGGTVTVRARSHQLAETECAAWQISGEILSPGEHVLLEVEDDGPGMDPHTADRIFDPFFSTKFTGRGLGLAAVLGIMRGHGGGLLVDSMPGRGTIFRLLFGASDQSSGEESAPAGATSTARLRVLVIDDEEAVRDMAAAVLEDEGFEVVTASGGLLGVSILEEQVMEIDAVLLDLSMPELAGEETFPRLLEIRPDLPVVLTSGYDIAEAARRFSGRGPTGFIQKPYRPAELVAEILRCVAGAED